MSKSYSYCWWYLIIDEWEIALSFDFVITFSVCLRLWYSVIFKIFFLKHLHIKLNHKKNTKKINLMFFQTKNT
jgi:hypothetical protein